MKKANTNDFTKEKLLVKFKESIKDLTPDEINDVMNYVSALKAQHILLSSSNHRKTNRK